jgi:tetratricopeptide (TPR) repeat protein
LAFYNAGQYKKAITDYNKAIKLKTSDSLVYTYRGEALADLGKIDQAIADYDKALTLNPGDIHAYAGRALVVSRSASPE